MAKNRITFDFESRSACDLKKSGAYKYSVDPTTKPTCLAFKAPNEPIQLLKFKLINTTWKKLPEDFKEIWSGYIREGFEFAAHNAFFDMCLYKNILVDRYGWPDIPFESFRCTAAKAAACALPRSLGGAGVAMHLPTQKDMWGTIAMMATCKPTRAWNAWKKLQQQVASGARISEAKQKKSLEAEPPKFLEYEMNPKIWETLYSYCKTDVKTEVLLDEALPDLIPIEQEIWRLNQKLNWRGLRVDTKTISKIVKIMESENKTGLKELDTLTMGLVTKAGARKSILDFLKLEGLTLPDIRAKTVEDVLKSDGVNENTKRLLEIRQALSKTSTKKYQAFLDRVNYDDRVRDILLYHGAVPTGRESGTGIQPQNFPRGLIKVDKKHPYEAVENVVKYDAEMLKLIYGDNLSILFSAILRNMIIPTQGHEFFVADFSKIEVAVLWWLADNWKGLEILNSGKDPYKYQAAANLGVSYEDIPDEGDARQLGKAQILGAGFRMGWKRFKESAYDQYRLKLTNKQSVEAIKSYREANAPVVKLWTKYEEACLKAVKESGTPVKAGKCVFLKQNGFLWITLPSGRKLAYRHPKITFRVITFSVLETDDKGNEIEVQKTSSPKETLEFKGLGLSKKDLQTEYGHGGIITENIVQAVARDLMMHALLRLEKSKYRVVLSVHDEGITEREKGKGSVEEFKSIMCKRPEWVDENLPIQASAWCGERYRK